MFFDHHFIGMHWIWWLIITAAIVLLIFNIIPFQSKKDYKKDAMAILRERFARGEIEREEFEERKNILERSN